MKNCLFKTIASRIQPVLFIAVVCISTLLPGCYRDKEEFLYPGSLNPVDCTTVAAKFAADVNPLILNKCATAGCHDASVAGGVILQTYAQISGKKDRIEVRALIEKSMPPSGPLTNNEVNTIQCWINDGAPNN